MSLGYNNTENQTMNTSFEIQIRVDLHTCDSDVSLYSVETQYIVIIIPVSMSCLLSLLLRHGNAYRVNSNTKRRFDMR